jgi:transglutaminase-like putative cysteine protease
MVGAAIRYPATTRYGIPTRLTWDSFEFEVRTAVTAIENVIAPVEPIAGFLTIAVLAALVMPVLADAFAIRARAAFESLTPALAVCAVLAVLGIDEYRVTTTVAILGAAIGVLAAHRRWTTRMDGGWLANRPVTVPSTTGALAVGAMLLASAVVAPRLPWADDTPLIDVEASASSKLVTVSPLVELQAQLTGERSNRTVMRVRTNAPNYLRLTSLESFDGRRWEGERSFGRAGGNLTDVGDGVDISASITLVNYGGRYVPTPYVPTRLDTTDDVRLQFDDDSSTVRIDSGTITNYDVTAVGLNPTAEQLAVATSEDAPDAYYELPDATDPAITAATRDIVGEGSTGLQMRRLQDYFRTFDYDVSIQVPRDVDPVLWFLDARRGFCQQFSGAFAVMARSIGVPARVAVGFTPGELAPNGTYTVAGRHAHAWPEVWFDDIGWVAFEPTPGRGLPDQFGAHTGVPQQQAGDDVPVTPVTTTTSAPQSSTTAPSQAATATTRPNFDRGLDDGGAALGRQTADESTFPWAPVVLAGGALVGGLVWWKREQLGLRWRRWRRWRRASSAPDRVRAAWGDVLDAAASRGVHASGPDTDRVVAAQIQARLVPGDKVTRLVRLAEFAAFSGTASEADVAEATDLSARMTALILDAPPTVPGLRASEPATP